MFFVEKENIDVDTFGGCLIVWKGEVFVPELRCVNVGSWSLL